MQVRLNLRLAIGACIELRIAEFGDRFKRKHQCLEP